jgi:hypothetical protein
MREITGTIKEFPAERADGVAVADAPTDELSRRRATKRIS